MPVRDLREWIERVKEMGELTQVDGADPHLEIGGLVDLFQWEMENPALLFERIDQIGHPKPVTATRLATLQLLATLRSRNLFATEELEEGISSNALIEELTRAFLSYLEIRWDS